MDSKKDGGKKQGRPYNAAAVETLNVSTLSPPVPTTSITGPPTTHGMANDDMARADANNTSGEILSPIPNSYVSAKMLRTTGGHEENGQTSQSEHKGAHLGGRSFPTHDFLHARNDLL